MSRFTRRLDRESRRRKAPATVRRRRLVLVEMLAAVGLCVGGYVLFVDYARHVEVALASRIIDLIGVDRISGVLGDSFVVFGPGMEPVVAEMTGSCTILSSVLALAALAGVALRQRPQVLPGFVAASVFVLAANQLRLVLSLLAGRYLAVDALIFFHDWIGAVINFAYTLFGLLIMIGLTMYDAQRAEQDRSGRHTADRPAAWAKPGLGHRVPVEKEPAAPRVQVAAFVHRRVLPKALSRRLAKRREQRRIDYRVGHENPARRAQIIRELAAKGLGVHTATLLAVASYETDASVLDALAAAVAERQWEPVHSGDVVALRLWARAWLMQAAAGGDLPASAPGSATGAPASTAGLVTGAPASTAGPAVGAPASATSAPISAISVTSGGRLVAVTGAGGPAGVAVIRALQAAGENVLALDANPDAVGLRLTAHAAVLPRADQPGYAAALLAVIAGHHPAALIGTVAEEYAALIPLTGPLAELGTRTWIPEHAGICLDKIAFATTLHQAGVPHPVTAWTAETAHQVPGPWVVKPARGRGSRDVILVDDPRDLSHAFAQVPEAIVQTRLTGREFTADALVDRDGRMVACVPRWREETRGGISVQGTTFASLAVTEVVAATLRAVRHTGPANVQGFVSELGDVTIVEVNPRFSGGLPLTLAAGADVVNTYLHGILNPHAALPSLGFRANLRMARHFSEVFYDAPALPDDAVPAFPAPATTTHGTPVTAPHYPGVTDAAPTPASPMSDISSFSAEMATDLGATR
ncbi:ATP-grasp domain-containing protein [Actinoplanes sp. NPDC020271]|uniref:ATP-grasp domain-containing protein n=1 Tax=Actinoplanes sp. NPDC020271 TaxID=3363896 RepID=UPI0037885F8D